MLSRRAFVTAAAIVLTCSALFAEDPSPPGRLQVRVAIASSPDYIEEWHRTPPDHPITIKRLETLQIGQTAYIAFIISGQVVGDSGQSDVSVDFVIRKPDGSSMFDQKGYATVKQSSGAGGFVMADPALDFNTDPGDPVGLYRVEATAFDRRANTSATGFSTVEVVPASHGSAASDMLPFRSESEFQQWLQNYYQSPSPHRLVSGVIYYSNSSLFENRDARMPVAQFFASAYGNDATGLRSLVDALDANPTGNGRVFALHVLWLADSDASKALIARAAKSWREQDVQEVLARMGRERPRHLLDSPVTSATDLDRLWSMFFATGDRRCIVQIASVLPLVKEGHGLDMVLGGAAQWSLRSNAKTHKKVLATIQELDQAASGNMKQLLEEIIHSQNGEPGA